MKYGIYIGTTKESISALVNGILQILSTDKCGDGPKMEAMRTMAVLSEVKNATVTNCTISTSAKSKKEK